MNTPSTKPIIRVARSRNFPTKNPLKSKRNAFAHGLWFTHESGRVFLAAASSDMKLALPYMRREVLIPEIECDLRRMQELADKIQVAISWVDPNPLEPGKIRMRLSGKLKAK